MSQQTETGLPAEGAFTQPFSVRVNGKLVPLLGMAARDGFGCLGVRLVYSDHEGIEALRAHAYDFGIGRDKVATHDEITTIVRNPGTPWSIMSMPVHDESVRAGMGVDEFVVHAKNAEAEMKAMLKKGIILDTKRRYSSGYYRDFPIVKIKFLKDAPADFAACTSPEESDSDPSLDCTEFPEESDSDPSEDYSERAMPFSVGISDGMQFLQDMEALDLKEEAQLLQEKGEYEKALPLMLRSVSLRENSHTICLSLSELADLYLDMLKLEESEAACERMLQEASTPYRYNDENQIRIANDILAEVVKERCHGLLYGMRVMIEGLKGRLELNGQEGIVYGRRQDSSGEMRVMVQVGSEMILVRRQNLNSTTDIKPAMSKNLTGVEVLARGFAKKWPRATKRSRTSGASSFPDCSTDSCATTMSIISASGPHLKCYTKGTCFRCPDGNLIRVEDIETHEVLVAEAGALVEVISVTHHEPEEREMVSLHVGNEALMITADHRIVIPRGAGQQTIPAGHLRVGDVVLCAHGEQALSAVERISMNIDVYQLAFNPDLAMETFQGMDSAMMTKGSKLKPVTTRRGGMKKQKRPADLFSIPATHDSWF